MSLLLRRHHKEESKPIKEVEEDLGFEYEEFTVAELKELADSVELEYDSRIKKDDLINLLIETLEK